MLVLFGALLVTACASKEPVTEPGPETMREQRVALEALVSSSKPPPEKGTPWYVKMRFEQGHSRPHASYFHLGNAVTGLQVGVFLEDDQLVALLEPESAEHLSDCLTGFNAPGGHWSHEGLLPYRDWAIAQDVSDNVGELASRHDYKPREEPSTFWHAAELVAYAPFIILSIPFIAAHALTGGADVSPPSKSTPLPLPDIRTIKPGDEFPEMVAEAADGFEYEGELVLYEFTSRMTAVGVEDGVVVTVETPSQNELERRQRELGALYKRDDCAALMSVPGGKPDSSK
ncbi:MAG: hypothetical protein R3270_07285 [Gammaproteobacteria bacterium]|nr:hypothetical protein [Gammaproteobacteria bacterium]